MELTDLQMALLGLVWTAGWNGMSRSRIATLLWGKAERRSRRNLSQVLYRLNNDSPVEVIEADSTDLRPSKTLGSDLQRLRLYETREPVLGKPLERLQHLNRGPGLEQWLSAERSRLRHVAIDRNGQLLRHAEEEHEYDLAAGAAEAVLFYDPVNERALRSLVRATALASGAVTAEAAYKRHAPLFSEIMPDWKPSRETRRLLAELDSLKARQEGKTPRHQIQHTVRLIGRKKELTRLREWCLGDAVSWRDMVVLGEAGIGKSRLLEELSRQLTFDACRVVQIRNWPGEERIAFNFLTEVARSEPFREAIINLPPIQRKVLARSLALEHLDIEDFELPEVEDEAASRRLYEAARCLFDAVEGRVVLLVDGLASADASSLALLSFVRRRTRSSTVRLVGSVSAEALKETGTHAAYLGKLVEQIEDRIDLSPLSPEESIELARAAVEGDMEPSRAEAVAELGGGNPLFLIELAQPGAVEEEGAPPVLRSLMRRQLGRLSLRTRAFLRLLAAQREPVRFDLLLDLAQMPRAETFACIEEAAEHRIIVRGSEGVFFSHGLIQRWIIRGSPAEMRAVHRATAEALKASGPEDQAPDIAWHYDRAGEEADAFRWAQAAAEEAEERTALPDAVWLWRIVARNAPQLSIKASALCQVGKVLTSLGSLREASAAYARAEEFMKHVDDAPSMGVERVQLLRIEVEAEVGITHPSEALATLARLQQLARQKAAPGLALRVADVRTVIANGALAHDVVRSILSEVEPLEPESRDARRLQFLLLQMFKTCYGDVAAARAATRIALALADQLRQDISRTVKRAIIVLSWCGTLPDVEALQLLAAAEDDFRESGDRRQLFNVYVNLSTWYLDIGRLDDGRHYLDKAWELIDREVDEEFIVPFHNNVGEYWLAQGRYEESRKAFHLAVRHATAARQDIALSARAGLGAASLNLGRLHEAREIIQQLPDDVAILDMTNIDPTTIVRFKAKVYQRRGNLARGLSLVRESRSRLEGRHLPAWLKLGLVEAELNRRARSPEAAACAREGAKVATDLELPAFVNEYRRYL